MADRYRRLLRLFGRDVRHELDEELETHIALRAADLERAGLDSEGARREARNRMGDRRRLYRSARLRNERVRRREWLGSVRSDVSVALRRAVQAPLATAVALITLALGIGLGTAGFTVTDRVLLRPLPFPSPDRLHALLMVTGSGNEFPQVAAASWREWRAGASSIESTAIYQPEDYTVSARGTALRVPGQTVSGAFFEVLQAPLLSGRAFTDADADREEQLAVVSASLWRDVLESRPVPFGIDVDGAPYDVVGVLADGYEFPAGARIWIVHDPYRGTHGAAHTLINYAAIARVRDGVSRTAAKAELDAVARRIRETYPEAIYSNGVGVRPLREVLVGDARQWLLLLAGGVALVLLIACANVAGLALARGATRTTEMSVRVALGAGRGRLVRQLLTEQMVLAIAGAIPGVLLAIWTTRLIASRTGEFLPRAAEVHVDLRVLLFAVLLTVLAACLSGLVPALRTSTAGPAGVSTARGNVRGGRRLPGAVLVGAEVALALVLVAGTALLVRSFQSLLSRDLGFETAGTVAAEVRLTAPGYRDAAAQTQFWQDMEERLSRLPGVRGVALTRWTPGVDGPNGFIDVQGLADDNIGAGYRVVSEDYFAVLGVPIVAGRGFAPTDRAGSERVVIVNETMVREFWPDGQVLGRQVRAKSMELDGEWLTVVGVSADYRHYGFDDSPSSEMYVLSRQVPAWLSEMTILVRPESPLGTPALMGAVARTIREADAELAPEISTLDRLVDNLVLQRRFVLRLLGGFAALALILAAIGLYGMLSFAVARQAREMGVRAALGARRVGLVRLVLGRALRVLVVGAIAGLLGAAALSRTIEAMLVDVAPRDLLSLAAATLILLAVGLIAAAIPAWRAARTDPIEALRSV